MTRNDPASFDGGVQLAIETAALGLTLDRKPILQGIDLQVRRGEVFGVLGPNGAGKTTTVRVLNGLLRATTGKVRVCGLDPAVDGTQVRRRTGVLTEGPALYEHLSARDNLAFFGALHGLGSRRLEQRVEAALDAVDLVARADDVAGTFSKGMLQRLAIARAILHEPELLFLDEPTAGLDPASAARVTELVHHWRDRGRTVFLATHHLLDAERQCDRFAFFDGGRLRAVGGRDELERLAGMRPRVELTFAGHAPSPPAGMAVDVLEGRRWVATLADPADTPEVVAAAVAAGGRIMAVAPVIMSLQDLYFAIVGR